MQKERRLTGGNRFSLIRRQGPGWANRLLVLKAVPNQMHTSRFGFVVGKRTGIAVVRNRVRRRLKEAVRRASVKSGWDVLLIARGRASTADYHQLRSAADDLLHRSGLLKLTPCGVADAHQDLPSPVAEELVSQ